MTTTTDDKPDYGELWQKLVAAAAKLNAASDQINPIIESIEKRLKAMNIGVEVEFWVADTLKTSFFLGYGKVGRDWWMTWRRNEVTGRLLQAPRDVRLAALDNLPQFFQALNQQIMTTLEELEVANDTVAKIVASMPTALLPVGVRGKVSEHRHRDEDEDEGDFR